jgi:glutathione S-transferase
MSWGSTVESARFAMYQLCIANKNYSSWSLRPWVLMREHSIAFEERLTPFEQGSSHAKFRAFSPTGRVPCLLDGPTVVWDSLAIVEYLAERHAGIWPRDPGVRAWGRCAAAEMHAGFAQLRERCGMNCSLKVRLYDMPPALRAEIARIDELWSEGLRRFGGPWLAGAAFSAVDAFFAPVAVRVRSYALELSGSALEYASRLRALPSMQSWCADAVREPWRDEPHEIETARYGEVLEDARIR